MLLLIIDSWSQKQKCFSFQKMLTTGVVWITCGLLWCFYQMFGLSLWRHPFTTEYPLVSKWCNAKFSANLHFCMNYSFVIWGPCEGPLNTVLDNEELASQKRLRNTTLETNSILPLLHEHFLQTNMLHHFWEKLV